jgi:hypothetical protein
MDILFKGLNILISIFCVCADGFKVFQKLFTTLYINYQLFFASLKVLTNFKMLTVLKPSSEFSFSVIGRCSLGKATLLQVQSLFPLYTSTC